jgi:hypothetical protein
MMFSHFGDFFSKKEKAASSPKQIPVTSGSYSDASESASGSASGSVSVSANISPYTPSMGSFELPPLSLTTSCSLIISPELSLAINALTPAPAPESAYAPSSPEVTFKSKDGIVAPAVKNAGEKEPSMQIFSAYSNKFKEMRFTAATTLDKIRIEAKNDDEYQQKLEQERKLFEKVAAESNTRSKQRMANWSDHS